MTETYLQHHGILGQKWGVRRYQNKDGSLTSAGKKRYDVITELEKKSKEHQEAERKRYEESEEGKLYKKWRKSNPDADEDDFGDYLVERESNGKSVKEFDYKPNQYEKDLKALKGKNYINDMIITTAVSAFYLAPISAIIAKKATKSGKKAAIAYLGTIGALNALSVISDRKEQVNAEKKYGLR